MSIPLLFVILPKMTLVNITVIFVKKNETQNIGSTTVKIVVILLIPNVFLGNTQIASNTLYVMVLVKYRDINVPCVISTCKDNVYRKEKCVWNSSNNNTIFPFHVLTLSFFSFLILVCYRIFPLVIRLYHLFLLHCTIVIIIPDVCRECWHLYNCNHVCLASRNWGYGEWSIHALVIKKNFSDNFC